MAGWLVQDLCGLSSRGQAGLQVIRQQLQEQKGPQRFGQTKTVYMSTAAFYHLHLARFSSQVDSVRLSGHWC